MLGCQILIENNGLETTERLLGKLASSYFSMRGPGYAMYVTDQRIIGSDERRIPLLLRLGWGIIVILSGGVALFLLPSVQFFVPVLMVVFTLFLPFPSTSALADTLMKRSVDTRKNLPKKRDFELARSEISRVTLGRPRGRIRTAFGLGPGYVSFLTDLGARTIRITIFGSGQYTLVSDLMKTFCSYPPAVPCIEDKALKAPHPWWSHPFHSSSRSIGPAEDFQTRVFRILNESNSYLVGSAHPGPEARSASHARRRRILNKRFELAFIRNPRESLQTTTILGAGGACVSSGGSSL